MGQEPAEFPVRQFISYLVYRGCEKNGVFLADVQFMHNPRNGAEGQVPISRGMITADMMYWICLELGVNMPDEFAEYQRRMDWAGANLPVGPSGDEPPTE